MANSGNITCFKYIVFRHKLESSSDLWWWWRTFQGHRQSREKW